MAKVSVVSARVGRQIARARTARDGNVTKLKQQTLQHAVPRHRGRVPGGDIRHVTLRQNMSTRRVNAMMRHSTGDIVRTGLVLSAM